MFNILYPEKRKLSDHQVKKMAADHKMNIEIENHSLFSSDEEEFENYWNTLYESFTATSAALYLHEEGVITLSIKD